VEEEEEEGLSNRFVIAGFSSKWRRAMGRLAAKACGRG